MILIRVERLVQQSELGGESSLVVDQDSSFTIRAVRKDKTLNEVGFAASVFPNASTRFEFRDRGIDFDGNWRITDIAQRQSFRVLGYIPAPQGTRNIIVSTESEQ